MQVSNNAISFGAHISAEIYYLLNLSLTERIIDPQRAY